MTSSRPTRGIGVPVPRNDGPAKTTGHAKYTADVQLEGALFAKTLRSPYSHARILNIDTSAAEALPGVHAVVTGNDAPDGARYGRGIVDIPVIAQGVVRFVGEQLAAVAADDEETAERAIELIDVEYEPLPAVVTVEQAVAPGAAVIHPRMMSYKGYPNPVTEPTNLYTVFEWTHGDVEAGFLEADEIVQNEFWTPRQHQAYMEPHSCLVQEGDDGRMEVWMGNKSPFPTRRQIAGAFDIGEDQVVFNPVTIGGDFGGKGSPMDAPIAWLLVKKTGRPIRIVFDYTEDLTAANPRHSSRTIMKTGLKRDGTIVAHEATIIYDSGAYGGYKPGGHLGGATAAAGGAYRIPNTKIIEHQVYTNTVPGGYMRGPGEPQAMFAVECQIDCAATVLGIDPADLRSQNIVREGDLNAIGVEFEDVRGHQTLDAALEASGYRSPKPSPQSGKAYGRGVAIGERAQAGGETHAAVTINLDGSVVLNTSVFEQGTGSYTIMQQIVSDQIGVAESDVAVRVWTTDGAVFDSGIGGARVTRMASAAVHEAAQQAKEQLVQLASDLLGWPDENISFVDGSMHRGDTEEKISILDLMSRVGSPVVGNGDVNDNARNSYTAYTAQVAEVEVDRETGQVRLIRLTTAHDTGTVLNPIGHAGQVNGGVVQGIGYGLIEDLVVEDGRVTTPSFADYKIPSMADIPELVTVLLEPGKGMGPYGVKGIGENSNSQTAPAIANAVFDAVGVRIADLPVTAEKVYRAMREMG